MAKQRMTPSEALVETLVAEGVTDVFGLVGSRLLARGHGSTSHKPAPKLTLLTSSNWSSVATSQPPGRNARDGAPVRAGHHSFP